jgi:hypothetical protein
MPKPKPTEPTKIAYLFGAGATHAELQNIEPDLLKEKTSLLIKDVSSRVIDAARRDVSYIKDLEMVSGTKGSLNIELLISLIENSKIHGWDKKTQLLKGLVRDDIEAILTKSRTRRFYLHKALLEFHKLKSTQKHEKLIGLISLNYDDVLDQAFREFYDDPNYCFSLDADAFSSDGIPLLKLHGSFNWSDKSIRGRKRTIEIIPLGANKDYLHAPYGFIWNRTLEILIECDTLRVIGCSMSPNDVHLIDLLFKAHLERKKPFAIEIISSDRTAETIKRDYGFFPKIKKLTELEPQLVPEPDPPNPFRTWLRHKCLNMMKDRIASTKYVKRLTK